MPKFDCLRAALPGEPMFHLLARDLSAPGLVRDWAWLRHDAIIRHDKPVEDFEQVKDAQMLALRMESWRMVHDGEWRGARPTLSALEIAAKSLLEDVRHRHPGEALTCPLMIALDAALAAV